MYSRYESISDDLFRPVAEDDVTTASGLTSERAAEATAADSSSATSGGLRGLLGGLRRQNSKPQDLGDLLLLAIIALLVLEDGDETDLIIMLAVALIIGY